MGTHIHGARVVCATLKGNLDFSPKASEHRRHPDGRALAGELRYNNTCYNHYKNQYSSEKRGPAVSGWPSRMSLVLKFGAEEGT